MEKLAALRALSWKTHRRIDKLTDGLSNTRNGNSLKTVEILCCDRKMEHNGRDMEVDRASDMI
ncbi:hypothetical protein PRIPAC_88299 [Pristionchus pacificus]|uniref:Uncharacterized protein n=1 Tax=Pristionchus pacificus TaxID=54126 RepID=A0A2A6B7H5_PRIPA|nr:hypothetical protein PRIPAC_88299 [Pristionchus pacificus]|eukprot:PDM61832.1 hypothetical protein PRIPAC_51274 [Pristionchus pacificus]